MLDPDGTIASWNAGAERLKGYTEQEVLGRHFAQFFTPEDRAKNKPAEAIRIATETGRWEDEGWRDTQGRQPILGSSGARCGS